jgi:3-oxoacyl-[acyl-carrier-protein] synthase-3
MRKAGIVGMASWFPETIWENTKWPEIFIENFKNKRVREDLKTFVDIKASDTDNDLVIEYLEREMDDPFFGTVQRRIASETTTAVEAETMAAMKVLKKTGIDSKEIDLLISYSSLPDRIIPVSGNAVAHNIQATNAHCIGVDTSCASALSQLIVAKAMVESGTARYALLVQSHIVMKNWPLMHPASPNVGDCATAILVGPVDNHTIIGCYALSHGEHYKSVTYTRGKEEEDVPWWQPSDKAFYLGSFDSAKAKQLILNTINVAKDTVKKAIATTSHAVEDIDLLISVQPRKWVPEGIARSLGLPRKSAVQTFEKYAHLGPCGIIANLEEAETQGLLKPGTIVALYAQGAGFCRASAILEW